MESLEMLTFRVMTYRAVITLQSAIEALKELGYTEQAMELIDCIENIEKVRNMLIEEEKKE